MDKFDDMRGDFAAVAPATTTDFQRKIGLSSFDRETFTALEALFDHLQLPMPESAGEFLDAHRGALVFVNRYGVVLRIEPQDDGNFVERIDHRQVLKPIKTFSAGKAVVEICPGVAFENDKRANAQVVDNLKADGVEYWDKRQANLGRLPVRTPEFPQGMTLVVDRLAVRKLRAGVLEVKKKLPKKSDPQAAFYAPLTAAMAEAWPEGSKKPNPDKMVDFWRLCTDFVAEGKLVGGWNDDPSVDHERTKAQQAAIAAKGYDKRLAEKRPAGPKARAGFQPLALPPASLT